MWLKSIVMQPQEISVEMTQKAEKKETVVAKYSNIILDILWLQDEKYNMLLVSTSDGKVKGWDLVGSIAFPAKQPGNE